MFVEIDLVDNKGGKRGQVQIELVFAKKNEPNKWVLQEKIGNGTNGWSGIHFSGGTEGTFDVKDNNVLWLWDKDPASGKQRNTFIMHKGPRHEGDVTDPGSPGKPVDRQGTARIYDPKDPAFKDAHVRWKTKGLTPVRQRVLEIIYRTFPAYPGAMGLPNIIDSSKSYGTNSFGKITNCGVLPGWIARQLGYYLPFEEKYKNWKFRTQEYTNKIPENEVFKLDKADKGKSSFVSPLAAGWGHIPELPVISSYPILLEKARGLPPGTIWIPYYGGRQNKNRRPKPGDIYVLMQDLGGHFAHVGVIVDAVGSIWRTADCGQAGKNAAAYKKRIFNEDAGTLIVDPPESNTPDGGTRYLEGWIDIDHLYSGWKP